jgi:two-component system response regulator LytT
MEVLIAEDEKLLARRLQTMLEEIDGNIHVKGFTGSVKDTLKWLSENGQPDLIFMDIELADGQCFEIFEKANIQVPVIFTTAYDEYTLQAFKVNSVDYLLKPILKEDLKRAWEKFISLHYKKEKSSYSEHLQSLLNKINTGNKTKYRERFLVKKGQKMISVDTDAIAYITIRNAVSFLITRQKQKFPVDYTLDEIEDMLDKRIFFRVNRQFIISHDIIIAVHPWFNSKLKIEINQPVDEDIIVSREKSAAFKEWLGA